MPLEYTFAMIKSKAANNTLCGTVLTRIIHEDFVIIRAARAFLRPDQIQILYRAHEQRPYYGDLIDSVGHGVVIMALAGEDAVLRWRFLMGSTNPKEAEPSTIRYWARTEARMADNVVHGSADVAEAKQELRIFFPELVYPS